MQNDFYTNFKSLLIDCWTIFNVRLTIDNRLFYDSWTIVKRLLNDS